MTESLYFQDLHLTNFRLFKQLDVPKFSRINIFGGFNGAGKSALLETLFCLSDISHPLSFVKPYTFRGTNVFGSEGLDLIFNSPSETAKIEYTSPLGKQVVKIDHAKLPDSAISSISANSMERDGINSSSLMAGEGVRVVAGKGSGVFESYILPTGDGFTGTIVKLGSVRPPICQLLSSTMRVSPVEISGWLSDCVKKNKIKIVLEYMRILDPSIIDLTILYNGQNPTIYANRQSGLISVDLLGDGFRNLLTTILTIFRLENGIVLLDEIDTALHYSITAKFWEIISKAAVEANCQIFATSHSREAILSASKGINSAGCRDRFLYMRLERSGDLHNVISYTMDELEVASEYGFEFR